MSDTQPDPIDQAYAQAEALLSDDAARAARRARVLAAVASEPAAQPTAALSARRSTWRRGGWLAAASVVGLAVFAAVQLYRPALRPAPAAPSPVAVQAPAAPADLAPRGIAPSAAPASQSAPAEETATRQANAAAANVAPPKVAAPVQAAAPVIPPRNMPALAAPPPPPPPLVQAPAPRAFPAEAPEQPVVAEAGRSAAAPAYREAPSDVSGGVAVDEPAQRRPAARDAIGAFAGPPATTAVQSKSEGSAGKPADLAARLRAAAAAGRAAEVASLLDEGAPVDAPDAAGDTALMKSVRADHPAAAALLRRHGASLDHKNHAGESVRNIATEKGDPDLNQAIGLAP